MEASTMSRVIKDILLGNLGREAILYLEDTVTYFVAWYEYTKGVKLNIKNGYFSVNLDTNVIRLNKEIEKVIQELLNIEPDPQTSAFLINYETADFAMYNGSFRDSYTSIGIKEKYHSLYYLFDTNAPHQLALDFVGLLLHDEYNERVVRWAKNIFSITDTQLIMAVSQSKSTDCALLLLSGIIDKNEILGYDQDTSNVVHVQLPMYYIDGDLWIFYDNDRAYKVSSDYDLNIKFTSICINNRFVVLHTEVYSSGIIIDIESDESFTQGLGYSYYLIQDSNTIKTVRRKAMLTGGMVK